MPQLFQLLTPRQAEQAAAEGASLYFADGYPVQNGFKAPAELLMVDHFDRDIPYFVRWTKHARSEWTCNCWKLLTP